MARVSTVFTGSGDARARAFDAQSGALQRVFRGHAFIINCIQVGAPAAVPGPEPSPPAAEGGAGPELASPRPQHSTGRLPKAGSSGLTAPTVGFGSGCSRGPRGLQWLRQSRAWAWSAL